MKKAFAAFMVIVMLICVMTSCSADTEEQLKKDFSSYNAENDVALVYMNFYFIFKDFYFSLDNGIGHAKRPHSYATSGKILYSYTYTEHGPNEYTVNVCAFDVSEKEETVVFSKKYASLPEMHLADEGLYLLYAIDLEQQMETIDLYSIDTGEYCQLETGNNLSLDKYENKITESESRFVGRVVKDKRNGDYFEIEDVMGNTRKTVCNETLLESEYGEILKEYNFTPKRVKVEGERVFLVFSISYSRSIINKWGYNFIVFEYNYETETVQYKLIANISDVINWDIVAFS